MSKPLSIVADRQIPFADEAFPRFANVSLVDGRSITADTLRDADVLLIRSITPINEALLKDSPISFVGSATSGIDHVDINYLRNSNIGFAHAPGSNARSVAEYVLSCLFVMAELNDFDLMEKTVGIIGCGQIGTRLLHFLDALGVKCLLNDPPLAETVGLQHVELAEIAAADIISLHVPLNTEGQYATRDMVNQDFLSRLRSDVILVNTSRGEVVNEADLIAFKKRNPNATLILDVWRKEPTINLALLQEALIATPHIAGYSLDGKLKASSMLLDALTTFIDPGSETPAPNFPQTEKNMINLDEAIIQLAVMQSYDVRSDAAALRHLLILPAAEQAAYFDSLRKHYPVRREFTRHVIRSANTNKETALKLERLGFEIEKK